MREQYNPFIGQSDLVDAEQRLPTNVKPTHYDILLQPDLDNASFEGSVAISLEVLEDSTFILLNAVDLDILTTDIVVVPGNVHKIRKVHYHKVQQTVMVPLPETIPAGTKMKLLQTFRGRLNDSKTNSGFMRSSYKGLDGKSKWIGSTQGQPTGIRQIFPCADEPALKATFSATLIIAKGLTCLSNTDVASEQSSHNDTRKMVVFNKTPLMSTYLVAFVVGELNYIESNDFRVPVRVYATPDHDIKGGKFALDVGARAMISHEKTFGSPYPLPKLDMVAVPGHSGGMENWGCVIYDEKYLVQDESGAAANDLITAANIVIHELAHQWFGNIVTAEWWNTLWLNESFADWATYNAVTHMFPDWDPWSDFVAGGGRDAYQAALTLDSNRGSHPIEVPVSTPEQIAQIFDAITYAKGCSVLRMISEYLGVDVFIEGVRLHLQKHAFGSATTNDLWNSLSAVSGKDVQKIMAIWTQQVGYPVLSIIEDEATRTIEVSQHRFLQSGKTLPEDDHSLYPVYLKTKSASGIDQEAHLFDRKARFPVDRNFYKLNADQTGLYRVSYPLSRLEKFGSQLSSGHLSPNDRVGLLSDLQAIVASGHVSEARTSHLLSFISKFRHETNYFVWRQLLVCFQAIRTAWMFEDAETLRALCRFQTHLMNPILKKLDHELWDFKPSDSYNTQNFKAVLFSNAEDHAPVKRVASCLFKRFMEGDHDALNPNIRKVVFDIALSDEKASSGPVVFPIV
jgi:aminopeptidase 2